MSQQKKEYDVDEELDNFEITESVLNNSRIISPKSTAGRKKIGRRISIVLPEEVIQELGEIGKERGLGYQTVARLFLIQKIDDEKKLKHKKAV